MNKLTKYLIFILYQIILIIEILIFIFLKKIIIIYKLSKEISFNKNKLFILKFWIILIILLKVKKKIFIIFHL